MYLIPKHTVDEILKKAMDKEQNCLLKIRRFSYSTLFSSLDFLRGTDPELADEIEEYTEAELPTQYIMKFLSVANKFVELEDISQAVSVRTFIFCKLYKLFSCRK